MDGQEPSERLKLFRKKNTLTQMDVANAIDRSQAYIAKIEKGIALPSQDMLSRLRNRFGLSSEWLLYGSGPMIVEDLVLKGRTTAVTQADLSRPAHGDFAMDGVEFQRIRRWDISASAGPGLIAVSDDVGDHISFTTQWLIQNGINGDLAGLIRVSGDSMAPTIFDGDLVLVHRGEMSIENGKIYAFTLGEEVFVKRLSLVGQDQKSGILMISDNPLFPPHLVSQEEAVTLRIAGRVRACISSL
ncbi:XRE family transcriptional regulator [Thalassococcus sp. S3]|uniref:XRE family transcriptional regulator n=1 Tax=Thalassococcus sp. S3 TaxID=2017482 RepID=UPI0013EED7C7|nr:XRE family transcriptional regulator [Thalassococcus sp. S3]